jgi:hypothetical protein
MPPGEHGVATNAKTLAVPDLFVDSALNLGSLMLVAPIDSVSAADWDPTAPHATAAPTEDLIGEELLTYEVAGGRQLVPHALHLREWQTRFSQPANGVSPRTDYDAPENDDAGAFVPIR